MGVPGQLQNRKLLLPACPAVPGTPAAGSSAGCAWRLLLGCLSFAVVMGHGSPFAPGLGQAGHLRPPLSKQQGAATCGARSHRPLPATLEGLGSAGAPSPVVSPVVSGPVWFSLVAHVVSIKHLGCTSPGGTWARSKDGLLPRGLSQVAVCWKRLARGVESVLPAAPCGSGGRGPHTGGAGWGPCSGWRGPEPELFLKGGAQGPPG